MPETLARRSTTVPASYDELKRRVSYALSEGRRRAQEIVEKEKSRMYWEVGKLLVDFVEENTKDGREQASRGEQIIKRLAQDLKTNEALLYNALRFARTYPGGSFSAPKNLTWTHHRSLLAVPDEQHRRALAAQAEKHDWSTRDLSRKIQELYGELETEGVDDSSPMPSSLRPKKGLLHTYRVIEQSGALVLDLGFDCLKDLTAAQSKALKAGFIVGKDLDRIPDADARVLYTYAAQIDRVIDGDTFWAVLRLDSDIQKREKIRLRGIDCPELVSAAGQKAKKIVEDLLQHASDIVITTSKTDDKYGRYLGDVYATVKGDEIYLNKLLLDKGLAKFA